MVRARPRVAVAAVAAPAVTVVAAAAVVATAAPPVAVAPVGVALAAAAPVAEVAPVAVATSNAGVTPTRERDFERGHGPSRPQTRPAAFNETASLEVAVMGLVRNESVLAAT